jgi:hypothetical protein
MTTLQIPVPDGSTVRNAAKKLGIALQALLVVAGAHSRPIRSNLVDHGYTLLGFGCISGASFLHSAFTGLLVTGILLLIFEWKVSDL